MKVSRNLSPERREQFRQHMISMNADPEIRARQRLAMKDVGTRKKLAAAQRRVEKAKGSIVIPDEYRKQYNKMRRILGKDQARVELTKIMNQAAAGAASGTAPSHSGSEGQPASPASTTADQPE